MSAVKQLLDHKLLSSLSPLCDLSPDMLTELSAKSQVEQLANGATVFKRGARDPRTLYLIAGNLSLTDADGRRTTLKANSPQARSPIDDQGQRAGQRTLTVVASGAVTLLNIDTSLLEMLLDWGQKPGLTASAQEAQEDGDEDWMSRFLQSRVFLKLRAENIQAMMMRMEDIGVCAGDEIVKQGDSDDSYYVIARGRATVSRKASPDAPSMKLATLTAGTGFGEEALISNGQRNASVTMDEDGRLMRLSKDDFISLLVTPVLQYLSFNEAQAMQAADVEWLDVRALNEYSQGSLPDARNISLGELRLGLRKLNKLHKYIVYSNHANRSAAAVFLLSQQGLDAYVLADGLTAVPRTELVEVASAEAETLPEPTAPDNVVSMPGAPAGRAVSEERIEVLMSKAKTRVQQEMRRTQAAEDARKQAQAEVERLKSEADAARKAADEQMQLAADKARSDAERQAAQHRAEAMARQQAETEAAAQRAEAEAGRAAMAEQARQQAESEIERLKDESAAARREVEEQIRRSAEQAKQEAEKEIIHLKAEAEMARRRAEEQVSLAADKARSEAERELARQRAEAMTKQQDEVEGALQKAEQEAMRAQQAEEARRQAEEEIERMRLSAQETQRQMEEQSHLAVDQARTEAERDAARIRAEELAVKQAEIEVAMEKADAEAARATAAEEAKLQAEAEVARLKSEAEAVRIQAEEQARMAADQARSEAERQAAGIRAEEMARQQAKMEDMAQRAEEESRRARQAEEASLRAEAEIERLKVDAEVARMQVEEQAQRVADAARSEAERETARAQAAEAARQQAEAELDKLAQQAEQARLQAEVQAKLAADAARSEAERESARIRAEELAQQQAELEAMARRAEEGAQRAQQAEEARQQAEREIALRQEEAEKAASRAEEEAQRAQQAEEARQQAEQEIARRQEEVEKSARQAAEEARRAEEAEQARLALSEELAAMRAEAEAARAQVERQARLFAAAQRLEAEETAEQSALSSQHQAEQVKAQAEMAQAQETLAQQQEQLQRHESDAEQTRALLAEAEAARAEQEASARQAQAEAERSRQEAEAVHAEREAAVQAQREELAQRQREMEAAAREAQAEAERSRKAAEAVQRQAAEDVVRLKAEAEVARIQAEIEAKRSIAQAKKEAGRKQVAARAAEKARRSVAADRQRKQVDQQRAQRQREAREQALGSMGLDDLREGGLTDMLSDDAPVANTPPAAAAKEVSDESQLIDPEEVMRLEPEARQKGWVSDDFLWDATLGYRDDPNVDSMGSPADTVGVETPTPEPTPEPASTARPADKPAPAPVSEDVAATGEAAQFSSSEINRSIRPQVAPASDKSVKKRGGKGRLGLAALVTSIALAAGVFYITTSSDAPPELKQELEQLVGKGTETLGTIEEKVSSTLSTWTEGEGEPAAENAPPAKDSEAAMQRLRQRVQVIRDENQQVARDKALEKARRDAEQSLGGGAVANANANEATLGSAVEGAVDADGTAQASDEMRLKDVMQALEAEQVDGSLPESPADDALPVQGEAELPLTTTPAGDAGIDVVEVPAAEGLQVDTPEAAEVLSTTGVAPVAESSSAEASEILDSADSHDVEPAATGENNQDHALPVDAEPLAAEPVAGPVVGPVVEPVVESAPMEAGSADETLIESGPLETDPLVSDSSLPGEGEAAETP